VEPIDVSILVVSFNTREVTRECLASIARETRDLRYEVIVVDNASSDGSAAMVREQFPQLRLIASSTNLGFARANNLAAREASGEWLLLLNPDTVVLRAAVQRLHRFAVAHPEAGVVGGRTVDLQGGLNPYSCRGRPTPWSFFCRAVGLSRVFEGSRLFDPESLGSWRRDSVREVDIVTGCLFMVSRRLWETLGGFDPVFFMYGEETDFCLRARKLGYRPMITPEATIVHLQGASERIRAEKVVRLLAAHSTLVRKHWSRGKREFGLAMLWLWAGSRALGARLRRILGPTGAPSRVEAWTEVWRRRAEWSPGFPAVAAQGTESASAPHPSSPQDRLSFAEPPAPPRDASAP
jgi:GT2 family glycosyltransferase